VIGVDRQIGILEVEFELFSVPKGIAERLGEEIAIDQISPLLLRFAPVEESRDKGFCV